MTGNNLETVDPKWAALKADMRWQWDNLNDGDPARAEGLRNQLPSAIQRQHGEGNNKPATVPAPIPAE